MTVSDTQGGREEKDPAELGEDPHGPGGGEAPFLAHHFESTQQQFEAGKLGMWLFLATEVLLFGGLFCAYAVFRHLHPEIFEYGSQFLDRKWGALNTVILILSSVTMACAVSAAQLGCKRMLAGLLALTFLGGAGFMTIKYVEYKHKFHENLVWGLRFYEPPADHVVELVAEEKPVGGDLAKGTELWMGTCRSCHGLTGEGIAGQGKDIRGSEFIVGQTDEEMLAFLKVGRMPFDPLNTTGIQMPPKGGNPLLTEEDLLNVITYLRTLKAPEGAEEGEEPSEGEEQVEQFYITRSSIPPAPPGPSGLAPNALRVSLVRGVEEPAPRRSVDPADRPANAHLFFGIYFCMTGLHGVHVLVGMAVIAWLIVRALKGHFSSEYFTPVDLGGLYWHVVDMIWIFLFPLLYLIA